MLDTPPSAYIQVQQTQENPAAPCCSFPVSHPIAQGIAIRKLPELQKELEAAKMAAFEAGKLLLEVRHSKDLQITEKVSSDGFITPVTAADQLANDLICKELIEHFPEYGLMTEEAIRDVALQDALKDWDKREYTWFIDPLDGTQSFIDGSDDFGIHIGLTRNGHPVLGVNYYPVSNTFYWAVAGKGAFRQVANGKPEKLHLNKIDKKIRPLKSLSLKETLAVYNRLFGKELNDEDQQKLFQYVGSMGLKICTIAMGNGNLYITTGAKGGLWDTCSGEVIIKEAGGNITDRYGKPINYRGDGKLSNGVIVSGNKEIHDKVVKIYELLESSIGR